MKITALILAAGQSTRMGQPKMLLPWGETTVLGQVIETIRRAGLDDIIVVTGGERERVEKLVTSYKVQVAHNMDFKSGGMLSSLQCGLRALKPTAGAALIFLGDQPQIQERSVQAVTSRFEETKANLVVPSYQMRRGHPWLAARPLWSEILSMPAVESPRDFLNRHATGIEYVTVDDPSILADLDTPDDYLKSHP
ncbi:MAG: Molybdenum cofactor cytidylyltransferase [Anaerolineales bacterium]|nr:Molybdenum cofactor cytidylyltransferase [Anaerolineales bacterium]